MSEQHTAAPRLDDEAQNRINIERVDRQIQLIIDFRHIRLADTPEMIRRLATTRLMDAGYDTSLPYRMPYAQIASIMDDPIDREVMLACAQRMVVLVERERETRWSIGRIALAIISILGVAIALAWVAE